MRPLSAADILRVWEWGSGRHAVDQALLILMSAEPEATHAELAKLTLGERDARLLEVRAETVGPSLPGSATCPQCATELEFAVSSRELRVAPRAPAAQEPFDVEVEGLALRLRCLDSFDLAEAAQATDVEAARRALLQRSVLSVTREGRAVAREELTEPVLERVSQQLEARDPQAEVALQLCCPECGHAWSAEVEIGSFFWSEIGAIARRLLHEVHCLASAYGWREPEILALSPARRQAYLELSAA